MIGCRIFAIGFAVTVAAIVVWAMLLPKVDQCESEIAAVDAARNVVRNSIASPSTAKFPSGTGPYTIVNVEECRYRIAGYFDAQNRFGAMTRARFIAEVYYSRDREGWYGEDVSIIE
jgi:hypothetical protein